MEIKRLKYRCSFERCSLLWTELLILQYPSKVSWQSLASRKTPWLVSWLFRVEKNNEFAGWLSFREVNWIREALLCYVEGKASHLSSSCLMKNAFNLSLLPERSTDNLSWYCNSQNDCSSQLIRTSLIWQDIKPQALFTPMVRGVNHWFLKLFCKVVL